MGRGSSTGFGRWVTGFTTFGMLMVTWAPGLAGCSSDASSASSNDPSPIGVPDGLFVRCDEALDVGSLSVNGDFVDGTVQDHQCLIYRFQASSAGKYSVQVWVEDGGQVDLTVAGNASFTDLVGAGVNFGSEDEATTVTATEGQTFYVALTGTAGSAYRIRVLRGVDTPTGEEDECAITVDGGELEVDGPPRDDAVFLMQCVLYRFEASADAVYRLRVQAQQNNPRAILVASDRELANVISDAYFPEPLHDEYPIAREAGTHYVLVVGERIETSHYSIQLGQGNAPIGLAEQCYQAEDRGTLPLDGSLLGHSVEPWTCDLYRIDATALSKYLVSLEVPNRGFYSIGLKLADDARFESLVDPIEESIGGFRGHAFEADSTGTVHVAVLGLLDGLDDYELRAFESLPPPSGLDFFCNRARSGGVLTLDGPATDGEVDGDECARHTLTVEAGVTYSVTVVTSAGSVDLQVSADADYLEPIAESHFAGPDGLFFTANGDGEVHVIVNGQADGTRYQLTALTTLAVPSGLSTECSVAVNGGELGVGAAPLRGYVAADHCVLYTFAGSAGLSHTVRVDALEEDDPDFTLASDASFESVLVEGTLPGSDVGVFTASSGQTHHLAVHGFQHAMYEAQVVLSPAPPAGLSGHCDSTLDRGELSVDGDSDRAQAVAGQCVLYALDVDAGQPYTITMTTSRGDPSLTLADAADYTSVVTEQASTGGETYAFTASASERLYVAVYPSDAMTTAFDIGVTSP